MSGHATPRNTSARHRRKEAVTLQAIGDLAASLRAVVVSNRGGRRGAAAAARRRDNRPAASGGEPAHCDAPARPPTAPAAGAEAAPVYPHPFPANPTAALPRPQERLLALAGPLGELGEQRGSKRHHRGSPGPAVA